MRRAGVTLCASAMLLMSGCVGSEPSDRIENSLPVIEVLDDEDPCEFFDHSEVNAVLFGEAPSEEMEHETHDDLFGCSDELGIIENQEEVGRIRFNARVFDIDRQRSIDSIFEVATRDQLAWFKPENQELMQEIEATSAEPIAGGWQDGETYVLDGFANKRDLYVVGAWGETEELQFGVTFSMSAEQVRYELPLVYHEYCKVTNLSEGCLISSEALYLWFTEAYLPYIENRLDVVSSE